MARRRDLTAEQTNVLTMHRQAIKEMYETAEHDMKTCQRGNLRLSDCTFETTHDIDGSAIHAMWYGDSIVEVRRLRIVLQGRWSIATESEYVKQLQAEPEGELA